MKGDLKYLLLCLFILLVVVGVIAYWFIVNHKPYTEDATIKGLYAKAEINQRCVSGTEHIAVNLLPSFYEPQVCGYNLTCVKSSDTDFYGICKAIQGGPCNTIYDCAPFEYGITGYCVGNACSNTPYGGIFSQCSVPTTANPNPEVICDPSQNLVCDVNSGNVCLGNTGFYCTNNDQCVSSFCYAPNGQVASLGNTGQCINQIPPAQPCYVNFCTTGYGCTGPEGDQYCQPLVPSGGTGIQAGLIPAAPGSTGAFCNVPYLPVGNPRTNLPCNDGLICAYDPSIPSVAGYEYGYCAKPVYTVGQACNSKTNACIPPYVCFSDGVTGQGVCQAPVPNYVPNTVLTPEPNINWCGINSSGTCGPGYECNAIGSTGYCIGETGYLCNTTGNFGSDTCISGTCSNYSVAVYIPYRSASATNNLGTWNFVPLPTGETTAPSNESYLSTFQYMDGVTGPGNYTVARTYTKLIYLAKPEPTLTSQYFWYAEIYFDFNNDLQFQVTWQKIDFQPLAYPMVGIKFTVDGNITTKFFENNPGNIIDVIATCSIDCLNLTNNTFIYDSFTSYAYITTSTEYQEILDWDFDDKYNLFNNNQLGSLSLLINNSYPTTGQTGQSLFYYSQIPTPASLTPTTFITLTNYTTFTPKSENQAATFIKYYYEDSSSEQNFMFNSVPTGVSDLFKIYKNTSITATDFYDLKEDTNTGSGISITRTNNLTSSEFYYISNGGFRFVSTNKNSTITPTIKDLPIEGYTPEFALNTGTYNNVHTLSQGNIDLNLYTIVSTCL